MPAAATPFFDLTGAQGAGYDDDAILSNLARTHNYNVDAALKAGHSKQEILQFLSTNKPPSQPAPASASASAPAPAPAPTPAQPQPMSAPGPGAGSPSASGFGPQLSLTPPPVVDQGLFMPSEARRRANALYDSQIKLGEGASLSEVQRRAQAGQLEDVEAFKRRQAQHVLDELDKQGVKITPRMRAEIASGMTISPERAPVNIPGYISGKTILASNPNATDAFGSPIDPKAFHRARQDPSTGITEYFPEVGGTTKRQFIDPSGKTWLATYDRTGAEMGREEVIDPRLLPTTTTNSSGGVTMVTQQVEDPNSHRLVTVQVPTPHTASTSSTSVRSVPGATVGTGAGTGVGAGTGKPAGAPSRSLPTPPPPLPGQPTAQSIGLPAGSRVIGTPAAQQKMDVGQQLTPNAQSLVLKVEPQLATLTRLQQALEPYKDSGTPLTLLLPRIAYSMGFAQSQAGVDQLLSNLEMTSITSAASVLPAGMRNQTVLSQARIHTADAWKDSGKLMYGKIAQIKQRLQDIDDTAKGPWGQKYPGLTPPPSAAIDNMVSVVSPEGVPGNIPQSKLAAAKARGFRLASDTPPSAPAAAASPAAAPAASMSAPAQTESVPADVAAKVPEGGTVHSPSNKTYKKINGKMVLQK